MLQQLNPVQRQAVIDCESQLLVLAGAGSGKTRVLTQKIAYLIRQRGIQPDAIIAVTFTNKAAREMRSRVVELLDAETAKALQVSTFHTLGLNMIRKSPARYGRKRGFTIYDSTDSQNLIKDIMRRDFGDPDNIAERVRWKISDWKQNAISPELARSHAADAIHATAASVYKQYEQALQAYNAVDFDDLILKPLQVLSEDAEYRTQWQCRIKHVLVDEYQDTNACQYAFIKQLVGKSGHFTVVGDDDQSIYAWRGARPENLSELQRDYPYLKVIKLEQNYRSTGNILHAANALIANNPHIFEKRLWSELGPGDQITLLSTQDEQGEAEQIVVDLMHHKFQNRSRFADYAILYRGNHQSRLFEQQLREKNIPYYLSGGMSFFDYGEIKDVMAYLRIMTNPDDDNALLRIINTPRRELGTTTVQTLVEHATASRCGILEAIEHDGLQDKLSARAMNNVREFREWLQNLHRRTESESPLTLLRVLLDDIGYSDWIKQSISDEQQAKRKLENVDELVQWVQRMCQQDMQLDMAGAVAKLALIDTLDRDKDENTRDAVSLMTLHAAKGLEFPYVYLVGMEENLLPHRTSIEEDSIEEERRLAYVGLTRAQRKLTLSYATQRRRFGKTDTTEPSRFLAEIPEKLLKRRGLENDQTPEERQSHGQSQLAHLRALLGDA
ncbi:MAG: AAA family ATPase [Gammaproteobacteria bacterium]|nr:AAA family ATPase [Gammaproteobacteria bacterium]